jgi:hypothetical protein
MVVSVTNMCHITDVSVETKGVCCNRFLGRLGEGLPCTEQEGGVVDAARLKGTALLKMALVAIVSAGALLAFAVPGKAQSESLPDLTVVKTEVPTPPLGTCPEDPGEWGCWQITVTNIGSGSAVVPAGTGGSGAVLVRDVMTYTIGDIAAISAGGGPLYGVSGSGDPGRSVTTWSRNETSPDIIAPGEVRDEFSKQVTLAPSVTSTTVRNCATVDPGNVIPESNESNNTSCLVTVVGSEMPTSQAQCKNGGFREFGFKSQGQCVAFVQRGPIN